MSSDPMQADVSVFLASSVHDMKNSISMLIGFLEKTLGQVDPATFPEYQGMAQMLYETQRINSNLLHLLTLFKVGKNLYPFNPEYLSVDDFVRESVASNEALLQSKGIALDLEYDPDLFWEFDRDLVEGVINHALNNAIHYTKDRVRLIVKESDGCIEFRVEDNGRGFPPRMLEEGAAAMRGVDFSTGSTGLGLYFSAVVAKLHRNRERTGEIGLENGGVMNGGCFVMRVP